MILVIDYKAGSLTSVVMPKFLGTRHVVVSHAPKQVLRGEKIVLPEMPKLLPSTKGLL